MKLEFRMEWHSGVFLERVRQVERNVFLADVEYECLRESSLKPYRSKIGPPIVTVMSSQDKTLKTPLDYNHNFTKLSRTLRDFRNIYVYIYIYIASSFCNDTCRM